MDKKEMSAAKRTEVINELDAEAKRQLSRAKALRARLMMTNHFIAPIITILKLVPAYVIVHNEGGVAKASYTTAVTDGRNLFFNPSWFATLSDDEVQGVIMHEVMHVLLAHHVRIFNRDPKRWNVAGDVVINETIRADKFALPEGGLTAKAVGLDFDAAVHTTDFIYNLESTGKMAKNINNEQEIGGVMPGVGDDGEPLDERGRAEEMKRVREMAATVAHNQVGSGTSLMERAITQAHRQPIDWRSILWDFMTKVVAGDPSWRHLRRRWLSHKLYFPSTMPKPAGSLALIMDTSGSISDEVLSAFQTEVSAIMSAFGFEKVHVVWHTDQVVHVDVHEEPTHIKLASKWSGGTDFGDAYRYVAGIEDEISAIIHFTDLEVGGFPPEPEIPAIFAIYNSRPMEAPWGTSVMLEV